MTYHTTARADARALAGGLALGAAVGLVLGGAYVAGGMARAADSHAQAGLAARAAQLPAAQPTAASAQAAATAPVAAPASARALAVTRVTAVSAQPFHAAADSRRELDCLADAVYYEARGESLAGQAAIAQVVLNRVHHPAFPKSVCGVVFQGARTGDDCQFSFVCDGSMRRPKDGVAWARAERIAARALSGFVMPQVGQATHFHVAGVQPDWGPRLMRVAQVGLHVFYSFGGHGAAPREPAAETPHTVYASMLPGLRLGEDPHPAQVPAAAPAAQPAAAAPAVVQASAAPRAVAPATLSKANADEAAAKPAQLASVS